MEEIVLDQHTYQMFLQAKADMLTIQRMVNYAIAAYINAKGAEGTYALSEDCTTLVKVECGS